MSKEYLYWHMCTLRVNIRLKDAKEEGRKEAMVRATKATANKMPIEDIKDLACLTSRDRAAAATVELSNPKEFYPIFRRPQNKNGTFPMSVKITR
ncbi:MAG: hypothetical protein LBP22_04005 [Deltaproteobacteria bacterium]|nr:hypothetical protein [Deltaproteobacteria bacterium]